MIYLTYDEYKGIGGTLDNAAFNRNIDRACGVIDNATHNRVETMSVIPQRVKALCRDLIDYFANEKDSKVSSRSQSAGAVSESVTYTTKSADEAYGDIQNMIFDYLGGINNDNGVPLLYRGAMC